MIDALTVRSGNRTVTIPASAMSWRAVRSSGPGGQNVNKVASKVELRVAVGGLGLDGATLARLARLAGSKLGAGWELVVSSQATRDQARNLEDARDKVRALLAEAMVEPKPRRATRPSRSSKERRLSEKAKAGAKKRDRRGRDFD